MEQDLKDHTSLMVIQSAKMTFFSDFCLWAQDWCKGLYEDVVIRNTPDGSYEILGKLIN